MVISLRFPHKLSIRTFPLPHICYMPQVSSLFLTSLPNNIWKIIPIMKPLVMSYFLLHFYLVFFSNYVSYLLYY